MSTEIVWREATRLLRDDDAFGPLVREVGPVELRVGDEGHFPSLARVIVYQQLAGKAAATIHGRFVEALDGEVTPRAVLSAPDQELRGAGLSRNKLKAIRSLAEHVAGGELPLDEIDHLPDDELAQRLTAVWGIGRWSADMFLMVKLARPDVWPVGDLGVRAGWVRVHGLDDAPDADSLRPLGDPYRPWRSAVAWYCWRAMETEIPA